MRNQIANSLGFIFRNKTKLFGLIGVVEFNLFDGDYLIDSQK